MKKLILILCIFTLSCSISNEDDLCNCTKETYEYVTTVVSDTNGMPHLTHEKVILSTEIVNCQDEQTQVEQGTIYFDITCD